MKLRLPALLAAIVASSLLALACYSPIYNVELSAAYKGGNDQSGKAILSFAFATPVANGVISEATHSIAVTVPFGTNVTALVPTIVQTGKSVSPTSGAAQDFTSPVVYTVTAADSSTQSYTVTVTVATSSTKAITAFAITTPAAIGVITEATHSIAVTVPYLTNVTSLVPTISYTGASISPGTSIPQNFTGPVVYTVTAPDASTQAYTVTVTVAPNSAKAISTFDFTALGASGVVTEASHTVAISVPYGTTVTALIPTITITGSSVSPNTGVAQNFTFPVGYTVTAADSTTQSYMVTVTILPSTNADLVSLTVDSGTLWPTFLASTTNYTVNVAYSVGSITVTAIKADALAGLNISPVQPLSLSVGANPVTVTVTAQSGAVKTYTVTITRAANPAKDITSFVFTSASNASLPSDRTGSIVGTNISVSVPYGTSLSSLVPTIASTGASVSPGSGLPMSFISPATYTVTAADSTTKAYTVTVTALPNPAKAITGFDFTTPAATGVITEASHTVAITVPYGTNVTALVPTITCTGLSLSPGSGVPQNFTSPVVYTVTAADTTLQNYTVTVTIAAASSFRISALVYNGPIWSSSDGGATWFSGGPSLNWTNIAGSSDGTKLLANAGASGTSSNIYRSTDGGVSWNILASAGSYPFMGMGSSDDGSILGATVYDGTYLFYYSKDSGTTWNSAATPGARYWTSAMSSSNGLNTTVGTPTPMSRSGRQATMAPPHGTLRALRRAGARRAGFTPVDCLSLKMGRDFSLLSRRPLICLPILAQPGTRSRSIREPQ
jgi:hypothetical protein